MAPGGGGEGKEIGIFLIKTALLKVLLSFDAIETKQSRAPPGFGRQGCLLADWQRQRQAQEGEIFFSSYSRTAWRWSQNPKVANLRMASPSATPPPQAGSEEPPASGDLEARRV